MLPSTARGPKNWAWLKTLKAAIRNWSDLAFVSRIFEAAIELGNGVDVYLIAVEFAA